MRSIKEEVHDEIVIKNSRFICYLFPIESKSIDSYLEQIKIMYPKATHYCYAYIIDEIEHSSDDGEPGGTAGLPILNVLKKEELNHVLAIVVRYYGGIKLGAGGLVRAYTKSVTETLKNTSYIDLIDGYKICLVFSYDEEKNIQYLLHKTHIISKEYLDNVTYICYVDQELFDKLKPYHPTILETCKIEKLN